MSTTTCRVSRLFLTPSFLLSFVFIPIFLYPFNNPTAHPQNIIGSKSYLGNQPPAILRDAAEEIISTLRDQSLRDPDRQSAISRVLTGRSSGGAFSSEAYSKFVALGKGLDDYDDYVTRETRMSNGGTGGESGGDMDDEMGVAVVFDESDEDEDGDRAAGSDGSDADDDEVVDVANSSSEEESSVEGPVPPGEDSGGLDSGGEEIR